MTRNPQATSKTQFNQLAIYFILALGILGICFPPLSEGGKQSPKITLVVGSWLPDEGPVEAKFFPLKSPFGVDFDSKGNMFIVELGGGRVLQFSPDGQLKVIAGDGSKSYKGDGGPAEKATFNGMHNVAVGTNDDIYIADSWNNCIRKIDAKTRIITTVAGTGKAGFSGDGGPATKATFNYVMCITFNKARDKIYIADINNRRIRVMDLKTGTVETVAGNGKKGVPKNGAKATESPLVDPRAVTVDSKGNVYILERSGHALRVVRPDGKIYTVAGTGKGGFADGPAEEAQLSGPKHLCVDDEDNIFIADDLNSTIRKYDAKKKTLSTVVGRGVGDPAVKLKNPHGVTFHQGAIYVIDMGHDRILKAQLR